MNLRRPIFALAPLLVFAAACNRGGGTVISTHDAAAAAATPIAQFLFAPDADAAARTLPESVAEGHADDYADLRRSIDQTCGPVSSATAKRAELVDPRRLELFYELSAAHPCQLRASFDVSHRPYSLTGLYLRVEPYARGQEVRDVPPVTRAAAAPVPSPVAPDEKALDVANAFVAAVLVKPDAAKASSLLSPSERAKLDAENIRKFAETAGDTYGALQYVRPVRFLRLSRASTFIYEIAGAKSKGSLTVLVATSGGVAAVNGITGSQVAPVLQPGADLPAAQSVDVGAR